MNKETYYVAEDYQHTDFGMQRNYTLDEWREQAIEYADNPQVPIKIYEYSMEETQSML